ncbi:MAG TPA: glutaminase, partial [Sulfurovum sp.]|nr:glutaminase [Sulfurovum sp.]
MNIKQILSEIEEEIQPYITEGKVADYIPALAQVDPNQFAMSITLFDGKSYHIGCSNAKFSIQSISKVFSFTKALSLYGDQLY